jgi:hypothetical protein
MEFFMKRYIKELNTEELDKALTKKEIVLEDGKYEVTKVEYLNWVDPEKYQVYIKYYHDKTAYDTSIRVKAYDGSSAELYLRDINQVISIEVHRLCNNIAKRKENRKNYSFIEGQLLRRLKNLEHE